MKRKRITEEAASIATRLLTAFMLLTVAFGANADDCFSLYAKSGAIPGTSSCKLTAASNTPVGLGNYYCINDLTLIDQWCNSTATPNTTPTDDSCPVADPVLPANGIVTLSETDFASGDASPLVFRLIYLSKPYDTSQTLMGSNWSNNWQRRIDLSGANASVPYIVAYRGTEQPVTFKLGSGAWVAQGNGWLSLIKAGDGYFYLKDKLLGTTEAYSDTTGRFYSETTRTGMIRELGYNGQRVEVISQRPVDSTVRSALVVTLTYDNSGRITSVVPPGGQATHYAYDAKGNLVSVTHPDAYVRQYLYEDTRFPNALTGIKDESGSRIATWTYDASGRAVSVAHPDTTRNTTLSYSSGGTIISSMSGASTYTFDVGETFRPRSIATPNGTVSRTWDAAGNLKQRVTPDGDVQYIWDSANRPTKAIATVAGKKTITTVEYSDSSSLRPRLVATPGKIREFIYDPSGNITGYAERATTDLTGEQGMQAVGTGTQLTVGARYDGAGRLLSATVVQDGKTLEDWTYTYDPRGNIATTRDAVSGWEMRTLARDSANRAETIAGNSGQAGIAYDVRGRVSRFTYDEPAGVVNGGLARTLRVEYKYAPNGTVSTRTANVSTNGAWWQPISDAELGVWLTNWALGNDRVSPSANLTGLKSDTPAFVPALCVECYMTWKAKLTGKLFANELTDILPKWGETTELMLSDQSQVPYPTLVPDLTASAKRSMLYSAVFGAASVDSRLVKCSAGQDREDDCFAKYESNMRLCTSIAYPMGGIRGVALCKQQAFEDYQSCRGY